MTENSIKAGATADPYDDAIAEEQGYLDMALARRSEIIQYLDAELSTPTNDGVAQIRQRRLARQRTELCAADSGLIFGRLDAVDGKPRRIGRMSIPSSADDAEPLVIDWRAPAAHPFYMATPVEPLGQARRRHIRVEGQQVVDINDEPLDAESSSGLVGEGALFAALDGRRNEHMDSAAATLQREQDEIVRADVKGPLVVQGGPGTGKTVVALHRAAYLLFANTQLAAQGVLTLGPSRRFLDYIAQVLPALGETAIVATTPDELVPGISVTVDETRTTEELKGRAVWQSVITRYVADRTPESRAVNCVWEGEHYEISSSTVERLIAGAISGRRYHAARAVFIENMYDHLVQEIADRIEDVFARIDDGLEDIVHVDVEFLEIDGGHEGSENDGILSEEEIESLRDRIAQDAHVAKVVGAVWPVLDPSEELLRLLGDEALLSQFAPELSESERLAVSDRTPGWSSSDVALLDAMSDMLGDTVVHPPVKSSDEFLAERAASQRDWIYGHVIVDEAQELSEMQWYMVARRTLKQSITAVGDIDQAESSHKHTTWAQAVNAVFGEGWTQAQLTIGYRTPAEVMALTVPILRNAGSLNTPPNAVRNSGIKPWVRESSEHDLASEIRRAFDELTNRWRGGTVGVIAAAHRVTGLQETLHDVPVVSATESKGLEWDATLVIDPAGIVAEPRGWNRLYVALTRSTQELGQIQLPRTH